MTEQQQEATGRAEAWKKIAMRLFFLAVALVILYFFLPTVVDFLSKTPQLASVRWW